MLPLFSLLAAASIPVAPTLPGADPLPEAPPESSAARRYAAADFARFAPRSALDMLRQVPGFAIDAGDTGRRGLGQASANVLINGRRSTDKSADIFTELGRISAASVAHIEIVDGATLDVPGLSGPVANVVTASRGLSGNFAWRPQARARRTSPRLTNGEVSVSGTLGGNEVTLSLRNDSFRSGNAGPERVFTPAGFILDRRDEDLILSGEQPRLSATFRRAFGDGSVLNLNAAGGIYHSDLREVSLRSGPGQPDRERRLDERVRRHSYELGGDYDFALAGGRLKLIGLHRFEHSPFRQTLVQAFGDGSPTVGQRFTQTGDQSETIGRGEYRWRGGRNDWQLSLEGALNRLDVENGLFARDASGDFVPVPFPNGAATVEERRAEAALSLGRPLASNLALQASIGGEYSQLTQQGAGGVSRQFVRPKGFVALAWTPSAGFDVSLRLEREVGQLNFFDFVASANVSGGYANAGNADLVPPQSWNGEVQLSRSLGPWGSATARFYARLISDIVDIVPVGDNGQSPGNLDSARVLGTQWRGTLNLDPLGWRGARVDLDLQFQTSRLTDPLTGRHRPINENLTRRVELGLRHDLPGTPWAWGAQFSQFRQAPLFRLDERWQFRDTPGRLGLFVEHKDVAGMTMRAGVDNLLGTNETFERVFYDGRRTGPIRYTEYRDRYYGPVFTLTVTGTI